MVSPSSNPALRTPGKTNPFAATYFPTKKFNASSGSEQADPRRSQSLDPSRRILEQFPCALHTKGLVPTVPLGMPSSTLRVAFRAAERPGGIPTEDRGNEERWCRRLWLTGS